MRQVRQAGHEQLRDGSPARKSERAAAFIAAPAVPALRRFWHRASRDDGVGDGAGEDGAASLEAGGSSNVSDAHRLSQSASTSFGGATM
jgi:hypothetical protein